MSKDTLNHEKPPLVHTPLAHTPLAHYQRSGWLGYQVVYREKVGSTNDIALEMAQKGAGEGLVVLADEQTEGRGRLNRRWSAPAGSSLLMSLLFRPHAAFQDEAHRITMACGLALRDAIRGKTGVPVCLKWPNDVIVIRQQRWGKVAGMLSEVGFDKGQPAFLVVGIGLNVNVPGEILNYLAPNAASLQAETGLQFDRTLLLDAFLSAVDSRVTALRSGSDVLAEWRDALAWIGLPVIVATPTGDIHGIAESVGHDGALILRLPDGSARHLPAGDVSLRPD